ncbi:MAG: hypothetical protein ACI3ZM_06440 [Candidatus Cryptobacteroides sp.]
MNHSSGNSHCGWPLCELFARAVEPLPGLMTNSSGCFHCGWTTSRLSAEAA